MVKLNHNLEKHLDLLISRYPTLKESKKYICKAYLLMEECYLNGGKLLIAGNGGSSSDADHIVGELMKGFVLKRDLSSDLKKALIDVDLEFGEKLASNLQLGLPAISLSNHSSLNTAYLNDIDGELCFAQQLNGYGKQGDVLLAITTSGNSKNIIYAAITAKAKGLKVIGLSGKDGGKLNNYSDVNIIIPEEETFIIQELHLPIYHCLCLMLEERFFLKEVQK